MEKLKEVSTTIFKTCLKNNLDALALLFFKRHFYLLKSYLKASLIKKQGSYPPPNKK